MNKNIIISLTSYPRRIDYVHKTIKSLLDQEMRYSHIILWLAHDEFVHQESDLPESLLCLRKDGLEIRWVDNFLSYKKLIPALNVFPDSIIVTADDDSVYDRLWLYRLYADYENQNYKKQVYTHRAHHITFDNNAFVCRYKDWIFYNKNTLQTSFLNVAIGIGGILYPPGVLYKDATNFPLAKKLAPYGDDLFFWAMAVLNNCQTRIVPNAIIPKAIDIPDDLPLWPENVDGGRNDIAFANLTGHYRELLLKLLVVGKQEMRHKAQLGRTAPPGVSTGFVSADYWEESYQGGGNSGAGSYGRLQVFKAEVLNRFIVEHHIQTVIEFGVGDGAQLETLHAAQYTGFDVSETIIAQLRQHFTGDETKQFYHISEFRNHNADLCLSLDVLYHLVEDDVFHAYMQKLFAAANRYVIIYSSNIEGFYPETQHVRHRKFTRWIKQYADEWKCIQYIQNKYPLRHKEDDQITKSFSDFYIFHKENI